MTTNTPMVIEELVEDNTTKTTQRREKKTVILTKARMELVATDIEAKRQEVISSEEVQRIINRKMQPIVFDIEAKRQEVINSEEVQRIIRRKTMPLYALILQSLLKEDQLSRKKKVREAGKPTKAPAAYFLFQTEKRADIQTKYELTSKEVKKKTAQIWREMSDEEKLPWVNAAEEIAVLRKQEMEAFQLQKKLALEETVLPTITINKVDPPPVVNETPIENEPVVVVVEKKKPGRKPKLVLPLPVAVLTPPKEIAHPVTGGKRPPYNTAGKTVRKMPAANTIPPPVIDNDHTDSDEEEEYKPLDLPPVVEAPTFVKPQTKRGRKPGQKKAIVSEPLAKKAKTIVIPIVEKDDVNPSDDE